MYTVKHAAALTGVPAGTLRMWERRYGVVAPVRTEGGYRLYDDAAIARLTAMHALVTAGWSPRRAALQVSSGTTLGPTGPLEVTSGSPEPGRADDAAEPDAGPDPDAHPDAGLLVRLAGDLDATTLNRELDRVFADADLERVLESWLMPALRRLGAAWHAGAVSVAGEHFVSAGLQRRLAASLDAASVQAGAARVLVGLPRGARHELGVLSFAVLLARAGADVLYVGADLPPDSWVVAVVAREPDAVVIGVPTAEDVPAVRDTVAAISAARPDLSVLLGGSQQDRIGAGTPIGHSLTDAVRDTVSRLGLHR